MVCPAALTDPMSGFFILDRRFFEEGDASSFGNRLQDSGRPGRFRQRPVRFAEVPYRFRNRERGDSKLDVSIELEYLYLLIDKLVGRFVPTRSSCSLPWARWDCCCTWACWPCAIWVRNVADLCAGDGNGGRHGVQLPFEQSGDVSRVSAARLADPHRPSDVLRRVFDRRAR
jgi:hypothetical protein